MRGDERAYVFYLVLLLIFVASYFLFNKREKLSTTLQQAAIWGLIFVGVIIAYGFKDVLKRQMFPTEAVVVDSETLAIGRARDGHFYVLLEVNGQDVEFVVDTGASDVVLTFEDARLVGLNPENLNYFGRANTANGIARLAEVSLGIVKLGEFTDYDVPAVVNQGDMLGSLLGMTYLSRFQKIEISGNTLYLTR